MAFTNTMRFTGLSGIDTTSMVDSMMKVESLKYDALYKKNMTYSYKHEAYQSVGNKLVDIQNSKFNILASGSLRSSSTYGGKKSTVTDAYGNESKAISVTTTGNSKDFSGTISSEQLATAQSSVIRGYNSSTTTADGSVGSLEATGGSFDITLDGATRTITYTAKDASDFNTASNTQGKADVLNKLMAGQFTATNATAGKPNIAFGVSGDDSSKLTLKAGEGHSGKITASADDDKTFTSLGFTSTSNYTAKSASEIKMGDWLAMGGLTSEDVTINGKSYTVSSDETMADFVKRVNENDSAIKVSYSSMSGNMTFTAKETGVANAFNVNMGYGATPIAGGNAATDAVVKINGETFYSSSNSFTFDDGTKLQLNGVTTEPLNVSVSQDTAKTASAVHDFVDTYNSILQAIYDQTETSRPKSASGSTYQPLTEEERSAMSDSDLVKWDENAKKGLLYKDESLRKIESDLRSAMSKPVTLADGTSITLGDLGISLDTADIGQRGKLVINDDKLNAAIDKYGAEGIAAAFTTPISETNQGGFADRVDSILRKSVGPNGTLTQKVGLNSNKMDLVSNEMSVKEIQNARDLADLQAKLAKKETWYYKMFSNMETQIQKSNQQLASLG